MQHLLYFMVPYFLAVTLITGSVWTGGVLFFAELWFLHRHEQVYHYPYGFFARNISLGPVLVFGGAWLLVGYALPWMHPWEPSFRTVFGLVGLLSSASAYSKSWHIRIHHPRRPGMPPTAANQSLLVGMVGTLLICVLVLVLGIAPLPEWWVQLHWS